MPISEIYHYYAPDDRIYGPVDRATLQKWEKEGRLVASSKLRRKGETEFTTWEKVKETPPLPEPTVAPTRAPIVPSAAIVAAPEPVAPLSIYEILEESLSFYKKHFRTLVLASCILQLISLAVLQFATACLGMISGGHGPLSGALGSTDPSILLTQVVTALIGFFDAELCIACLTLIIFYLHKQRKVWASDLFASLGQAFLPIAFSSIVRIFLPIFGLMPFSLALGAAITLKTTLLVKGLLFLMSLILLLPPIILTLRLLLTTQVIALEGQTAVSALQRSNSLVRHNPGDSLFSSGEIRIMLLVLIPLSITLMLNLVYLHFSGIDLNALASVSTDQPKVAHPILIQTLMFLGGFLITPLYASILYSFYSQAASHTEE